MSWFLDTFGWITYSFGVGFIMGTFVGITLLSIMFTAWGYMEGGGET